MTVIISYGQWLGQHGLKASKIGTAKKGKKIKDWHNMAVWNLNNVSAQAQKIRVYTEINYMHS